MTINHPLLVRFGFPGAVLAVLAVLASCNQAPPDDDGLSNAPTEPVPINAFFDEVFEREVAASPVRQSLLGRKTDRLGEWDDITDGARQDRVQRAVEDLQRLHADYDYERLDAVDRLSYDLFDFEARRLIADHDFHRHAYVVDQFNGQLTELITVLKNNHPIASREDAEHYISRIAGLETVLGVFVDQLRDRADAGVMAPAFSFPAVIADATRIASGAPIEDVPHDNAVFADFHSKLTSAQLAPATEEALIQRAKEALKGPFNRGLSALIVELERQRNIATENHGVWALPNGEAYYRNRIRHHTTLDLSAEEIHQIGIREVARLQDAMRETMEVVGFEGTLVEFFEFIRNDPNNYYENTDAGREQFLQDARERIAGIYEVVGDYFNTLPTAALEVRRVEPWRENSTSIAFYDRPSEDGSRPGIYYANLADMRSVQKYVFSAITYHESAPGHHFQIALAQELDGLPKFRKHAGYGAYTEGWALYAEQLAREMGFYRDPLYDFGRLQNELWRAVRLVLDTGIHARRWTREQSIQYFRDNTPLSEGDIVTEVERFFVNPGQALGYKLGMMKILELRRLALSELGDSYDIRDFHDAVIGAGSLPLPLLERRVRQTIDAVKGAD